jgi:hypothetical protein
MPNPEVTEHLTAAKAALLAQRTAMTREIDAQIAAVDAALAAVGGAATRTPPRPATRRINLTPGQPTAREAIRALLAAEPDGAGFDQVLAAVRASRPNAAEKSVRNMLSAMKADGEITNCERGRYCLLAEPEPPAEGGALAAV